MTTGGRQRIRSSGLQEDSFNKTPGRVHAVAPAEIVGAAKERREMDNGGNGELGDEARAVLALQTAHGIVSIVVEEHEHDEQKVDWINNPFPSPRHTCEWLQGRGQYGSRQRTGAAYLNQACTTPSVLYVWPS